MSLLENMFSGSGSGILSVVDALSLIFRYEARFCDETALFLICADLLILGGGWNKVFVV